MDINWDVLIKTKIYENANELKTFCDVGANEGLFTIFFKSITDNFNNIFAFEANKYNFKTLKNNLNNECILENMAVSDHDGFETLYVDSDSSSAMSSIIKDNDFTKSGVIYNDSYQVQSCKLDSYFAGKIIDCIKIDVEGAELKVIKGALNTIKNSKLCLIECHFDDTWEEIFNILNGLDFKVLLTDEPIQLNKRPYQIYKKNIKI